MQDDVAKALQYIRFDDTPSARTPTATKGQGAKTKTSAAPYVYAMALMTAAYLLFELGFNARLLDVVGGSASLDEIHAIEQWGRIISGMAVTLAVWGTWILPRAHKKRWPLTRILVVLGISAGGLMYGTYHGEKALIDHIVDQSDGATRRAAVHLQAISNAVVAGAADIDGIDLSSGQADTPEGKSFLALFPFIALSTEDLEQKSISAMRSVLRSSIEANIGTAEQAYNNAFIPSVRALTDSYNQYVEGNQAYHRALAQIPRRQASAWSSYVADLRKENRRLTPQNVPQRHWERVRRSVRAGGLDIPSNWRPSDQQTFRAAVAKKVEKEALASFRETTRQSLGAPLPLGLEWKAFQAQEAVQKKWREELRAPRGAVLSHDMGFAAYRDRVYKPMIESRIDVEMTRLKHPAEEFEDGKRHGDVGRSAVEALVVPPIALAFSLIGALVHLFKSINYVSVITVPRLPRRRTLIVVGVAALAAAPFLNPNDVSNSRVFGYFEDRTSDVLSPAAAAAARWVVQAQPYFYPVNEAIRTNVLAGYDFGYQGKAELAAEAE